MRQARPSDVAIIAEFNVRMALETEQRRLDPARVHAGVAALLSDPAKGTYFLAEARSADSPAREKISPNAKAAGGDSPCSVAGQLLITYEWSDWRNGNFWWLQSVYVAEPFRGKSVFRTLFSHVQEIAKASKDVCGLRLYMDSHNSSARQTYERLGMKQTSYEIFEIDFVLK